MAEENALTPEQRYKEPLEKLVKFGKFNILGATVDGLKNMNPSNRALRDIFLTEDGNQQKRKELKNRLKKWYELLSNSEDIEGMLNTAEEKLNKNKELLSKNVKTGLDATRKLEESYRTMQLFFKNTGMEKIKNLTILNASLDQVSNKDFDQFRKAVNNELVWAYGTVGKSDNYSIMVVPGFLGDNSVIKEWAKMASDNKVLLVTDFRDLGDYDSVVDLFDEEDYAGIDKTNIVMTCNYLVGRAAHTELGEEEDVSVPPSAAMAGRIYNPNIVLSQPVAGVKHGQLDGVDSVRFKLLQEHIGHLDQRGLVPMVKEFGGVMPYSARTLFNGSDLGLKTYSVVMVFDWVGKVVTDFLNRASFEQASAKMIQDYRKKVVDFLNSIKGHGKLIKDFQVKKFEQDQNQKDRILVHIVMEPYFPAKSFAIKMDGTSGEGIDNYIWNTEIADA